MGNLFIDLPVPSSNVPGIAVDVSAMGKTKTIILGGTLNAAVTIEYATDAAGTYFAPVQTFQGNGNVTVDVAAHWMRANVSGYKGGAGNCDVGASDAGAVFVELPGDGSPANISGLPGFKTVVVPPSWSGNIEVSEDGTDWAQVMTFFGGGGQSRLFFAHYARVVGGGAGAWMGGAAAYSGAMSSGCVNHPDDAAIALINGDQDLWGADLAEHNLFQQFAGSPYPDGLAAWPSGAVGAPGSWGGDSGWLKGRWDAWLATPPVRDQLVLWGLLADTEYYFNAGLAAQASGQWVGWLAPSIFEHILEETVYFRQAVFGDAVAYTPTPTPKVWTPQQLRQIWTEWVADHAVNVSHFIDPQQTAYVDQAVAFHDTFVAFGTQAALQTVGCDCALDPKIIEGNVNFNGFLDGLMIGTPQAVPSVLIIQIINHLKVEGIVCNQIVALLNCGPA